VEYLFQFWQAFAADCRAAPHILFLSDYDGTLTPIVSRPEDAVLSPEIRDKLDTLAQKPTVSVGIITGRSLSEIKSIVAIEGIYYSGNHGLEIEGPGLNYISPLAETAGAIMKDLAGVFTKELAGIDGAIIQEKGLSLSVHYRLVKMEEESIVAETFRRVTAPLLDEGKIKVFAGKKVWEVKPPIDWHKGKAIEAIAREIKALLKLESLLTIYLGDDVTDEDAFEVLHRPEGWSIFVGGEKPSSTADYYLNSTAEVEDFLARLIKLK
jgi:trehalose 6-phosphate phosphatase